VASGSPQRSRGYRDRHLELEGVFAKVMPRSSRKARSWLITGVRRGCAVDGLQVVRLDRNKTHVLPVHSLRDGFVIDEVVLVRLHERSFTNWVGISFTSCRFNRYMHKVLSAYGRLTRIVANEAVLVRQTKRLSQAWGFSACGWMHRGPGMTAN